MKLLMLMAILAQDDAGKARDLLQASSAALKDAAAISFEEQMSYGGLKQSQSVILKRPNLLHVDTKRQVTIMDGKNVWCYFPKANTYTKSEQKDSTIEKTFGGPMDLLFFGKDVLKDAVKIGVAEEKDGDETYQMVAWQVGDDEYTLWLGAGKLPRRVVVKVRRNGKIVPVHLDYSNINLKPEIKDDTFAFTPPKDAKEQPTPEAKLLAMGADAPEIEGTDLNDKPMKLADFKGKVILLNFWFAS